ncbi:hypothetical protein BJY04DRAFT_214802 [Aspergillus karnatakaensis]|uniref:uncharacterized protein n=1 Tax=Aspergillus karnatakaensis TaxID=1810916 RepID=UPI003CCDA4BB
MSDQGSERPAQDANTANQDANLSNEGSNTPNPGNSASSQATSRPIQFDLDLSNHGGWHTGWRIPEQYRASTRYVQSCAGQTCVPASSIRAPQNTYPIIFRTHRFELWGGPNIPQNVDPGLLCERIFIHLRGCVWGHRPDQPIRFHVKIAWPTANRYTTPITIVLDAPSDLEFNVQDERRLIEALPQYIGLSWEIVRKDRKVSLHQARINWFVDEIIDRQDEVQVFFARFDASMENQTCTTIATMCEPCKPHLEEALTGQRYNKDHFVLVPGTYPILYYYETTSPSNPLGTTETAAKMSDFLTDLYGQEIKVYSEVVKFRLTDQDMTDPNPGSSILYLVEYPEDIDERIINDYAFLSEVDVPHADWQMASPEDFGCPNLVRLFFFEACAMQETAAKVEMLYYLIFGFMGWIGLLIGCFCMWNAYLRCETGKTADFL